MKPDLVSIVTPAYNAAAYIGAAIESAQAQTYPDWEMLVVDDGSLDGTREVVARYAAADERVRLLTTPRNAGPAVARQVALDHAQGRYLAFLDSDDLWLPAKLERQLAFMRRHREPISFTAYRRISADGTVTGRLIQVPDSVGYLGLLKHNVIACLTAMVDREVAGVISMTDSGYDDFILWLRILRKGGRALGLQEDLARYRVVPRSVSRNRLRAAKWVWNIYRSVERLPLPTAAWCFANYVWRVSFKHHRF